MSNAVQQGDPVSLTEKAYRSIAEAIARRTLMPGEPLTQDRLAKWLAISRTPVREALRRLEQDGIIQTLPGRGLVVAELTLQDVVELLELLGTLEPQAVALAARRRSPEQAQRLIAQSQALLDAALRGDHGAWLLADTPWHETLLEAAGNRLLGNAVRDVRRKLQRVTYNTSSEPPFMRSGTEEHLAVAELVRDGDPERARALWGRHLEAVGARAIKLVHDYIVPVRGERF
jgi:DNA-binding GntR family transcriptional regulator